MARTHTRSPRWARTRAELAGQAYRKCAPLQKQLALALGCSEKWASELCNGHPSAARFVETVERLARSSATDAAPLAVLPLTVLPRVLSESATDDELDDLYDVWLEVEHARESRENRATLIALRDRHADPETAAAAEYGLALDLIGSLAAQANLTAILLERHRRRVERPRAH